MPSKSFFLLLAHLNGEQRANKSAYLKLVTELPVDIISLREIVLAFMLITLTSEISVEAKKHLPLYFVGALNQRAVREFGFSWKLR